MTRTVTVKNCYVKRFVRQLRKESQSTPETFVG